MFFLSYIHLCMCYKHTIMFHFNLRIQVTMVIWKEHAGSSCVSSGSKFLRGKSLISRDIRYVSPPEPKTRIRVLASAAVSCNHLDGYCSTVTGMVLLLFCKMLLRFWKCFSWKEKIIFLIDKSLIWELWAVFYDLIFKVIIYVNTLQIHWSCCERLQ